VDREAVHDVFGIPIGGVDIDSFNSILSTDEFLSGWLNQYPKDNKGKPLIRASTIFDRITKFQEDNLYFKMNFLTYFMTKLIFCVGNGVANLHLVKHVSNDVDVSKLDWCGYVLGFLRSSRLSWQADVYDKYFFGPATFLTVSFIFSIVFLFSFKIWQF